MIRLRALLPLAFLTILRAQTPADTTTAPQLQTLAPNLARLSGVEPTQEISYVRFFLLATPEDPAQPAPANSSAFDLTRPTLTAQCTQDKKGKLHFELFVNYGNVTDTTFYPPWRPSSSTDLFPPRTDKVTVTMEFLGYTRFKPVKRQFEKVTPFGQLRYNNPASGSTNLEEFAYYLQVLRALPTLRLTAGAQSASFLTTPLLAQLHAEPLCRASGV